MSNNSFIDDQLVVMQPSEEGEFSHHLRTLRKEMCTLATNIRKYAGVPDTIDFRIVIPLDGFVAEIFVREEDWQKMEANRKQYSSVLLAVLSTAAVITGVTILVWSIYFS